MTHNYKTPDNGIHKAIYTPMYSVKVSIRIRIRVQSTYMILPTISEITVSNYNNTAEMVSRLGIEPINRPIGHTMRDTN